uniref:Serine aminopeptidase S33 domain-containing protein n=1 Tax=Salix viminalis TaxID=40686 RepID=A0A6N2L210_SALVM
MLTLTASPVLVPTKSTAHVKLFTVQGSNFPSFLPKEVENIKDPFARRLATRIERLPVGFADRSIMSSCVKPLIQSERSPVVLLHGFDRMEIHISLLEEAERLPSCDVASKRDHLYRLWKSYIRRPIILIGPSLGAAIAIDFAVNHPEAVEKLVLIDASVYTEDTGNLAKLPRAVAYAGDATVNFMNSGGYNVSAR